MRDSWKKKKTGPSLFLAPFHHFRHLENTVDVHPFSEKVLIGHLLIMFLGISDVPIKTAASNASSFLTTASFGFLEGTYFEYRSQIT